jgi:FHS family L-fucose permease-like MFS transporter
MNRSAEKFNPAFATVMTLFFIWGFVTSIIDPLLPSVRSVFSLTYAESMLTRFAFFIAYGAVSLPAAAVLARLGFPCAIALGLAGMIAGRLLVPLATWTGHYGAVLAALFVIAAGVTQLQVAANPLAALFSPPSRSHFRLTLSQAVNSLGHVLAALAASFLMLSGGMFSGAEYATGAADRIARSP